MEILTFVYGGKRLQRCDFYSRKTNEKLKTYDCFYTLTYGNPYWVRYMQNNYNLLFHTLSFLFTSGT